MAEDITSTRIVYHIAAAADLAAARGGTYAGSPLCRRDGFIHMSARSQLAGSLRRFFKDRDDLVLLEMDTAHLGAALHWDTVPDVGTFPHFYGTLSEGDYRIVGPLTPGPDGIPVLPAAIDEGAQ